MPNGNQPVRSLDTGTLGQVIVTGADGYAGWADLPRASFKEAVRAASTTNLVATRVSSTLTATSTGALGAMDGVTLAAGDRVLLKDQTTSPDKGIYTITSLGGTGVKWVMERAADFASSEDVEGGMVIPVSEGTLNGNKAWQLTTNDPIVLNTDSLAFAAIGAAIGVATPQPVGIATAGASGNASDEAHVHARGIFDMPVYRARYVAYANVADLSAFVVAQDGVTGVAGDIVLLANQTTVAECGLYLVGTVAGTAPLTRIAGLPAAAAYINGTVVEVSEGTLFAGSTWKSMATGAKVVGTHDPLFYPRNCRGTLTLSSGTKTLGSAEGLYLFSTTRSSVNLTLNTAGGTVTLTVGLRAAAADRTEGKSGTGALIAIAIVAAGTINVADESTVDWLVSNW